MWELPRPAEAAAAERAPGPVPVHVKLGDYGNMGKITKYKGNI